MSIMDPQALPLARKVLDKVTSSPDQFDMGHWYYTTEPENNHDFCGTSACLAGWAIILSGQYPVDDEGLPIVDTEETYSAIGARLLGLPLDVARGREGEGYDDGLFFQSEEDAVERLQALIAEAESVT